MHWEAVIELGWRCIWRRRLSELRDALGGHDWASLEIHLEAVIEWIWGCTLRPWSSEVGDAIGDRDLVNSEMHWEAVIERVWRCTCRLWSSEIGDALAGYDRARLEEYLEAVDSEGGVTAAETLAVSGNLAGSQRLSILGWCCSWCMLYSLLSHAHGMER